MRSSKLVAAAGLGLLALTSCRPHAGDPADAEPADPEPPTPVLAVAAEQTWFAAYLQGTKIGYMTEETRPAEHEGQPALEYVNTSFVALQVLGQSMQQSNTMICLCDPEFHPLKLQFTQSSGGRDSAVVATFSPELVSYTKTTGDSSTTGSVPIPEGIQLVADAQAIVTGGAPPVGETITLHQFNPALLDIEAVTLTTQRTETLALAGETIDATVVALKSPSVVADIWLDPQGRLCQVKALLMNAELIYRRESEAAVMDGLSETGAAVDLMTAAALRPDKPLPGGRLEQLTVSLAGIDPGFELPSDGWQTATRLGDGRVRVAVDATGHDADIALKLPVAVKPELAAYLKPAEYVESDAEEIVAQAKAVVGAEANAAKAMGLLRDWVHQKISWQSNIGMIRSALDVLKDPAGVCRDAAALYAAVARAAGLPTRVCGGVVYYGDRFLGHAWNETWLGEWVPVDCTRPGPFVDATHIKLAQGPSYNVILKMAPAVTSMRDLQLEAAQPAAEATP